MNKTVIILRGVSGSGKSSFATLIKSLAPEGNVIICSADDYFFRSGTYKFKAYELPQAHKSCWGRFNVCISNGVPVVIVDNTNTGWESEAQRYKDRAEEYDYRVISLIVENRHDGRSVHGVPDAALERQLERLMLSTTLRIKSPVQERETLGEATSRLSRRLDDLSREVGDLHRHPALSEEACEVADGEEEVAIEAIMDSITLAYRHLDGAFERLEKIKRYSQLAL